MGGVTSCGIDCILALGRARLDGHGRDCVVSSPLLPAVGWSSFSRLRPAGSRSLDACAATCRLRVGLSSCAFWCCSKASFCAFFWSWYFAGALYFGLVLRWGLVLWPGTFAEGGILEGYFGRRRRTGTASCTEVGTGKGTAVDYARPSALEAARQIAPEVPRTTRAVAFDAAEGDVG